MGDLDWVAVPNSVSESLQVGGEYGGMQDHRFSLYLWVQVTDRSVRQRGTSSVHRIVRGRPIERVDGSHEFSRLLKERAALSGSDGA